MSTNNRLQNISRETLLHCLDYKRETGCFFWKNPKRKTMIGVKAGRFREDGYGVLWILGKTYLIHRLVWLAEHGKFPEYLIDHIDHNPSNNKIGNLRQANHSQNKQNRMKCHSNNRLKLLGVTEPYAGIYAARISANGKNINIGRYKDPHQAHQAYLDAKKNLHAGFSP